MADAEDMGQYKIEASNQFGTVTQTCMVTVICKYIPRHRFFVCR